MIYPVESPQLVDTEKNVSDQLGGILFHSYHDINLASTTFLEIPILRKLLVKGLILEYDIYWI